MTVARWGSSWVDVATVAAITIAMYVLVLGAVRVAGRRTLTQLSAFDVVVSIALGTILGSTVISPSVSYAEGMAAVLTLLLLQVAVAAIRRSSPLARRLLDFRPVPVMEDGRYCLPGGWLGPQLTEDEVRSQLRLRGAFDPDVVSEALLEPIGGLSVARAEAPIAERRSVHAVLESHLALRRRGELERDLAENYSPDVVVLSAEGTHRGHDGVRALASVLRYYVPSESYDYERLLVEGDIGMLRWAARAESVDIHDGVDTYVVRNGRIVAQTIHFGSDRTAPHTGAEGSAGRQDCYQSDTRPRSGCSVGRAP